MFESQIRSIVHQFIQQTNPQWRPLLAMALDSMDQNYLYELTEQRDWLPGLDKVFAAFSRPLDELRYILLGESPYPRVESANGYAFWDNAVGDLWSDKGLSKPVNRATSLRNFIKMLLVARGDLSSTQSNQDAIAALDKKPYYATGNQLFTALLDKGFVLLNATLVFRKDRVQEDARQWRPFIHSLFQQLASQKNSVTLLLLGRIAAQVSGVEQFTCLRAEHPYNVSFITNPQVLQFFQPLDLLAR